MIKLPLIKLRVSQAFTVIACCLFVAGGMLIHPGAGLLALAYLTNELGGALYKIAVTEAYNEALRLQQLDAVMGRDKGPDDPRRI
jgi:hypothetical protein